MKIPNYDPEFSNTNVYKQGHPCMPVDVFRMLICGPSNSGKQTSCCRDILYELLVFDKVYLFSKDLHQDKYQALLQDFAANIDPGVGQTIEALGDEILPLEELPIDNKKSLSLMTWFVKATRTVS